jgi:hypothetical protein
MSTLNENNNILNNNSIIEQINSLSYPACSISYQNEIDTAVKITKFLQVSGIINRTLKVSQVQKHTRLKIYKTLALPALSYGCETRIIREQDKPRITSEEMKFVRRTAKYTWQD